MNLKKKTSILIYCLKSPLAIFIEAILGIAFTLKIGQLLGKLCCNLLGIETDTSNIVFFGFLSISLLMLLVCGMKWVIDQIVNDHKIVLRWLTDTSVGVGTSAVIIFVPYWIGLLDIYLSNKFGILTKFLLDFGNYKISTWVIGFASIGIVYVCFSILLLLYYVITSIKPSIALFKAATYIPIEKEELILNNINNAQELEDFFVNVIF